MTASDMARVLAQLKSSDLVEALANVPREEFVGFGPWKVMRPPFTGGYVRRMPTQCTYMTRWWWRSTPAGI